MSRYLPVASFNCLETWLLIQQHRSYISQRKIQDHSGFEPRRCLCRFFLLFSGNCVHSLA